MTTSTAAPPVKAFGLLPRRADVSVEQFHEHWRTIHRDLALRITTLQRYIQNHVIDEDAPGLRRAPYEGLSEIWVADLETIAGLGDDPNYLEGAKLDEPNFMDIDRFATLVLRERTLVEGPPLSADAGGVKLLHLARRAPGVTVEQFRERWPESLGREAADGLGVRRHVVSLPLAEVPDQPFDGVRELSWPDLSAYRAAAGSGAAWDALTSSELVDSDASSAVVVHEYRVIWP